MKSYLDLKQDEFAEMFLEQNWSEDWDESDWEHTLSEWQAEMDAAIDDRWIEFRAETSRLALEHLQEAADVRREAIENR